jgi:hypothetical protein
MSTHSVPGTHSVPRLDELRELVHEQETELRVSVEELENVARRAVDPRSWICARPYLWTATAFFVGAWLGGRR